jgi:hypothetical protein
MATSIPSLRALTTVLVAGLFTLIASSVTYAHWDRYGGWGHRGWYGGWHRGWPGGWGWRGGIVIGPPLIYRPPPRIYYYPPPVYYYVPPPAYYGWPGYYPRY